MRAINDTERREVARNLREIEERTLLDVTDGELLDLLAEAVGLDGYEGEHPEGGMLYCLADLIDRPTCRNEEDSYDRTFLCSACGYEAYTYSDSNCNPHDFSYCPECGAEVVE